MTSCGTGFLVVVEVVRHNMELGFLFVKSCFHFMVIGFPLASRYVFAPAPATGSVRREPRPIPLGCLAGESMTADPDAVSQSTKTDTGGSAAGRDDGARVGRGRSAKLL